MTYYEDAPTQNDLGLPNVTDEQYAPEQDPTSVIPSEFDPLLTENPYHGIKGALVFASGARPEILAQCRTDEATHVGLGGTVVATAGLSGLSMFFALFSALHLGPLVSLVAAVSWGAVIFNLDRWLIVSQKRLDKPWKQWLTVLPRVAVAVLLGFVISEPLLHQVFRAEIDKELIAITTLEQQEARTIAENSPDQSRLKVLDEEEAKLGNVENAKTVEYRALIAKWQSEIDTGQTLYDAALLLVVSERTGNKSGTTTGKAGCGVECQNDTAAANVKLGDLERIRRSNLPKIAEYEAKIGDEQKSDQAVEKENRKQITAIRNERKQLRARIDSQATATDKATATGLLKDIEAVASLGAKHPEVNVTHWLLVFLFISLDTIPVIGKTLMLVGKPRPYEIACDAVDAKLVEEATQVLDDARIRREESTSTRSNDARIRSEVQSENAEHFIRSAADTQRQIGDILLARWSDQQLHNISESEEPPRSV